jgi:hypothetical protein
MIMLEVHCSKQQTSNVVVVWCKTPNRKAMFIKLDAVCSRKDCWPARAAPSGACFKIVVALLKQAGVRFANNNMIWKQAPHIRSDEIFPYYTHVRKSPHTSQKHHVFPIGEW